MTNEGPRLPRHDCARAAPSVVVHLAERLRVDELLEEGECFAVQPDVHVVLCDVQVEVAALLGVGVQQLIRVGLQRGRGKVGGLIILALPLVSMTNGVDVA